MDGDACEVEPLPGWDVASCVPSPQGRAVVVAETRPGSSAVFPLWRVRVLGRDGSGWVERLHAESEPDLWGEVKAVPVGIPSRDALLVAYRYTGSGANLEYDVLDVAASGRVVVAAHRGPLSHGAVLVDAGRIEDYEAEYPNDEPNCCPASLAKTALEWDEPSSTLRVASVEHVPPGALPAGAI